MAGAKGMPPRRVLSPPRSVGLMAALASLAWSCSAGEFARRDAGADAPDPASIESQPPAPPAEAKLTLSELRLGAQDRPVSDHPEPLAEERTFSQEVAEELEAFDESAHERLEAELNAAGAPEAPTPEPGSGEPTPDAGSGEALAFDSPGQPELFAVAREVVVRARPSHRATKIGYLRLGARVVRSLEPVSTEDCRGGWYRIMPQGYVCVGNAATLDRDHPVLAFARLPDRTAPLPYHYGRAGVAPSRLLSLPQAGPARVSRDWADVESGALPSLLAAGKSLPRPYGYPVGEPSATPPNAGFALLSVFDHGGRRYGLSTDYELLPLDQLKRIRPSNFHGIALEGVGLPVVFVKSRGALLYAGEPGRGLRVSRQLAFREALPITGESTRIGGATYLKTRSGEWLRDEHLVRVDGYRERPSWATGTRTWIHVSILNQTLVAYEGDTPVYATLVSTGADGLGDPAETRSTVTGTFLIHTKHVSTTMKSDEEGDRFLLSEVPYVQFFTQGYALHAAYWHDQFGTPRSHGCINLSPLDARWLFHFTEPSVPQNWHGALSLKGGTLLRITP